MISNALGLQKNLMPIGANIDGVADYSYTLAFVDIVKQSRAWGSFDAPWDGNCSMGSDGWPSQSEFGNVFLSLGNIGDSTQPSSSGIWLIRFTGNATISPSKYVLVDQAVGFVIDSSCYMY
jgi:hypothetical protein